MQLCRTYYADFTLVFESSLIAISAIQLTHYSQGEGHGQNGIQDVYMAM